MRLVDVIMDWMIRDYENKLTSEIGVEIRFDRSPLDPSIFSGGPGAPDTPLCLSPSPAPPTTFPTDR